MTASTTRRTLIARSSHFGPLGCLRREPGVKIAGTDVTNVLPGVPPFHERSEPANLGSLAEVDGLPVGPALAAGSQQIVYGEQTVLRRGSTLLTAIG